MIFTIQRAQTLRARSNNVITLSCNAITGRKSTGRTKIFGQLPDIKITSRFSGSGLENDAAFGLTLKPGQIGEQDSKRITTHFPFM